MPSHWSHLSSSANNSEDKPPPPLFTSWLRRAPEQSTAAFMFVIAGASAFASLLTWIVGVPTDVRLNLADALAGAIRGVLSFFTSFPVAVAAASLLTELLVAIGFAILGIFVWRRSRVAFFLAMLTYAFDAILAIPFGLWSNFIFHATAFLALRYLRRQWPSAA